MNNGAEDIQNALNALLQQGGGTDGSGQIVADMVNRSVASVTQVLKQLQRVDYQSEEYVYQQSCSADGRSVKQCIADARQCDKASG